MKMMSGICCILLWGLASAWEAGAANVSGNGMAPDFWERDTELECLQDSYPGVITAVESDAQGRTWLVIRGHARVLFEGDGRNVPPLCRAVPGVRATFAQPYPLEPERPPTPDGTHPGRARSYPLLHALYGADRAAVGAQLTNISLLGRRIRFSSSAGAGQALRRVAAALRLLVERRPELAAYVLPAGGFNWRLVQGESHLSPHSFGIAIDLNPRMGPYWRWTRLRRHPLQDSYPTEIVRIFEDNGFVWGGKWREYDIMHFEYRPEILCKARKQRERMTRQRDNGDAPTSPSPHSAR